MTESRPRCPEWAVIFAEKQRQMPRNVSSLTGAYTKARREKEAFKARLDAKSQFFGRR